MKLDAHAEAPVRAHHSLRCRGCDFFFFFLAGGQIGAGLAGGGGQRKLPSSCPGFAESHCWPPAAGTGRALARARTQQTVKVRGCGNRRARGRRGGAGPLLVAGRRGFARLLKTWRRRCEDRCWLAGSGSQNFGLFADTRLEV